MSHSLTSRQRRPHVLFLTAHDGLGADIAVHLTIARTLDKSHVRVSAATTLPEQPGASACEAFAGIPGITHLKLDLGRNIGTRHGLSRGWAVLQNLGAAANLLWLARWCRRNQVDVIHVTERPRQALFGLAVARLAGCACLIQAHISHYPHDATRLANLRLRLADAVVGVSRFTAETYVRNAALDPSRVFAVHNAVDSTVFQPATADAGRALWRQRLGIPADVPVIGCVARLMRWKGQARLIEAFAIIKQSAPAARLVLAGENLDSAPDGQGTFRDYLLRRADALGVADALIMPGFVRQAEMPAFHGALDVLAHPSLEEPFGLAVVEAMASSRPVIASDRGGTTEIIRHDVDGLLVPVDRPAALSAAVVRLLEDRSLYERLARDGRRRVQQVFTPDVQAAAMLNIYQTVLTRRNAPAATCSSFVTGSQTYA
jgi:glycosyltransferase involved in cell wall biosynthesis